MSCGTLNKKGAIIQNYQGKAKKNVLVLTSHHDKIEIGSTPKLKSNMIEDYNKKEM
jgi:hypothetical protein